MPTTRLSLMLPGAVALGAYEGGALAALLQAVQAAHGELVIDSIAAASAGSITALVAARALLCGADAVELMKATWVDLPALDRLKTHDAASPLSMEELRAAATSILGTTQIPDGTSTTYRQAEQVRLSMALTALGGLTYELASLRPTATGREVTTVSASTHVDFVTTALPSTSGNEPDFLALVDEALASGATPIGFPPQLLNRLADADAYRAAGLAHPSDDTEAAWSIWYSDGGDLDNEPFGRLLDLIDGIDSRDDRVIVLLDTEPSTPSWTGKWFDRDATPTWTSTLLHVNNIRKSQTYYEDLRRLEKTNTHLLWVQAVAAKIEEAFSSLKGSLPEADRSKVDDAYGAILEAGDTIRDDRQKIHDAVFGEGAVVPAAGVDDIQGLLQLATGLRGKSQVVVEIISPDIDPTDHRAADAKLAGEFLFHFGGFFDVAFRENDFALGYRNAVTWLTNWLPGRVNDSASVLQNVKERYDVKWEHIGGGEASVAKLTFREKGEVLLLMGHLMKVIGTGLHKDLHKQHGD